MKVYELMNELSKFEAGSEVKFSAIFSMEEIEEIDTDTYLYRDVVVSVDSDEKGNILICN